MKSSPTLSTRFSTKGNKMIDRAKLWEKVGERYQEIGGTREEPGSKQIAALFDVICDELERIEKRLPEDD